MQSRRPPGGSRKCDRLAKRAVQSRYRAQRLRVTIEKRGVSPSFDAVEQRVERPFVDESDMVLNHYLTFA